MALLLAAAIVHHRRKEKKAREEREAAELRRAEASLYDRPGAPQLAGPPSYSVDAPPPPSAVATPDTGTPAEPWPYWMPRPGHSEWDFAPKQAKRGLEQHDPPAGRPHSVRSLPYDRPQASLLPPPARPPPTPTQASPKGTGNDMRSVRNFLSSSSSSSSTAGSFSALNPTNDIVPVREHSDSSSSRSEHWPREEQEPRIWEVGDEEEDVAVDVEQSDGSERGITFPGAVSQ